MLTDVKGLGQEGRVLIASSLLFESSSDGAEEITVRMRKGGRTKLVGGLDGPGRGPVASPGTVAIDQNLRPSSRAKGDLLSMRWGNVSASGHDEGLGSVRGPGPAAWRQGAQHHPPPNATAAVRRQPNPRRWDGNAFRHAASRRPARPRTPRQLTGAQTATWRSLALGALPEPCSCLARSRPGVQKRVPIPAAGSHGMGLLFPELLGGAGRGLGPARRVPQPDEQTPHHGHLGDLLGAPAPRATSRR